MVLGGHARKISNVREVYSEKFSLCTKDSKHLVGHEGSIHNGRLEWRDVNQEMDVNFTVKVF